METCRSEISIDEPNAKRPKIETTSSTTSNPKPKDPFLSLPQDNLVKIISYTPIAQWHALELLDKNFQASTLIAWRQLRRVNVERDFLLKRRKTNGVWSSWSFGKSVELILEKLVEHSRFLTSLSGIDIIVGSVNTVRLLVEFEHLQSITLGGTKLLTGEARQTPLKCVFDFLRLTRSRTSLKKLRLHNVGQLYECTIPDQFAWTFENALHSPSLKLEKFSFTSLDETRRIRLDTLDTSRLTELCVGKVSIEPDQLTSLIERASSLLRIELSFLKCQGECNAPRLQANKKLLIALASHENLTAIKFDWLGYNSDRKCTKFGREFIVMLKTIGRRGRLRELAMEKYFLLPSSNINMNDVCATIRDHMPHLRSIKLPLEGLSTGSIYSIVSMTALEGIDFTNLQSLVTADTVRQIGRLPHLKRLSINIFSDEAKQILERLADVTTLTDLRIGDASSISDRVFRKWSDGFGSNLETLMLAKIDGRNKLEHTGLVRMLKNAGRLRVLILKGRITDLLLWAIATSCPQLEVLGVESWDDMMPVQYLQLIVDWCPNLRRLGGIGKEVWNRLDFPKYRKIGDISPMVQKFGKDDFDDMCIIEYVD